MPAPPNVNPDGDSVRRRMRWPVAASSGLGSIAGATTSAATIVLSPASTQPIYIEQVEWSYAAAPTGGGFTIVGATVGTAKSYDITAGGPGSMTFNPPLAFNPGEAVTITLNAGGAAGATGKVGCEAWTMS